MASIISADSGLVSGVPGLKTSADSSGTLQLQSGNNVTALTVNASQNVGIGTTSPAAKLSLQQSSIGATTTVINAVTETTAVVATIFDFDQYSTVDGNGSSFVRFRKANGTAASPTLVGANRSTGRVGSQLYDGAAFYDNTLVRFSADGTPALNSTPGRIEFWTTPSGSAGGIVERMRIDSSGRLLIGTSSASGANYLQVNSDALINGLTLGQGAGAVATNTVVGANALAATTTGDSNVAVGSAALNKNTTGTTNIAVGANALYTNVTGTQNIAIGTSTLYNNTVGGNVAIGHNAANSNTTGTELVAIGTSALQLNTTGARNTAVGAGAMLYGTTSAENTAVGASALYNITTGNQNVGVGLRALRAITTASNNTAVGTLALDANTTGGNNTAIGYYALSTNTTASNNTAVGYQAGYSNTTGTLTAFGTQALYSNTTGVSNTAVGGYDGSVNAALRNNTTGNYNIAVGAGALGSNTTGPSNTAVGYQAGYSNTTGDSLVGLGYFALKSNTTGGGNTAVGREALQANTTANNNTAVGYQSFYASTGSNQIGLGSQAGYNSSGSNNFAIGYQALFNNTGTNIYGIGYQALYNNTGADNYAFGYQSLNANTSGSNNVAMGLYTGKVNTTGAQNTVIGNYALYSNTTGGNSTAVGYQAGYSNLTGPSSVYVGAKAGYADTSGYNVYIGNNSGVAATGTTNTFIGESSGSGVTTGAKNTIIGRYSGSTAPISATGSNYIVLSDGDGNVRQVIDSSGNVGIGTTSPGYKLDVQSTASSGAPLLANFQSAGGDTQVYVYNGTVRTQLTADNTYSASIVGSLSAHPLIIRTSNTERMRIDTSGNVLIGKTSTGTSVGPQFSSNGSGIMAAGAVANGFAWFDFVRNGSYVGAIRSDGGSNTSYNTTSDYRLKENISPMVGALAKVALLKPVTYKWKTDGKDGQGFIAHELQEVVPDCVSGDKDALDADGNPAYQGIDVSFLVATLTAAIQEQQALITSLTARIAALEAK